MTFDLMISSRGDDEAMVVENGLLAREETNRRSINEDPAVEEGMALWLI